LFIKFKEKTFEDGRTPDED